MQLLAKRQLHCNVEHSVLMTNNVGVHLRNDVQNFKDQLAIDLDDLSSVKFELEDIGFPSGNARASERQCSHTVKWLNPIFCAVVDKRKAHWLKRRDNELTFAGRVAMESIPEKG